MRCCGDGTGEPATSVVSVTAYGRGSALGSRAVRPPSTQPVASAASSWSRSSKWARSSGDISDAQSRVPPDRKNARGSTPQPEVRLRAVSSARATASTRARRPRRTPATVLVDGHAERRGDPSHLADHGQPTGRRSGRDGRWEPRARPSRCGSARSSRPGRLDRCRSAATWLSMNHRRKPARSSKGSLLLGQIRRSDCRRGPELIGALGALVLEMIGSDSATSSGWRIT